MNRTTFFRSCYYLSFHNSQRVYRWNWKIVFPHMNNSKSESANRYIVQPPLTSTVDDSRVRSSDVSKIWRHTDFLVQMKWFIWSLERLFSFWGDVSMTNSKKLENGKLSACICKQIRKKVLFFSLVIIISILLSVAQIFFYCFYGKK